MKKSTLFLLELTCDLLIFALCAALCVGLMSKAKSISDESGRLTQAVLLAQSAAERFRMGLPPAPAGETGTMRVETEKIGSTAHISVWDGGRMIYELKGVTEHGGA